MNENPENNNINNSVVDDPMMAQTPVGPVPETTPVEPVEPVQSVQPTPAVSPLMDTPSEIQGPMQPTGPEGVAPVTPNVAPVRAPQKNNKTLIIIIAIVAVAIVAVVLILVLGKDKNSSSGDLEDAINKINESIKETEKKNEELSKNYIANVTKLPSGHLLIETENKNSENVYAKVSITLYDKDKKPLGSDDDILYIMGKSKGYSFVYLMDEEKNYETYDVKASFEFVDPEYYTFQNDKLKLESENKTDSKVIAVFKNNSGEKLEEASFSVFFYKGTELVGYDNTSEFDIAKDGSKTIEFDNPTDEEYDDIDYDKYDIKVDYAFSTKM